MSVLALPRSRRLLAGASVALLASLALLAGSARADGVGSNPQIEWHAAFSSGQTTGLTAGTPIVLSYVNPSANTSVRQWCWSPAPIDRPACGTSNIAAPAQAGAQPRGEAAEQPAADHRQQQRRALGHDHARHAQVVGHQVGVEGADHHAGGDRQK